MSLPEKLSKCPRTPECTAKKLYRDGDDLYSVTAKGELVLHTCTTRGSEKPKLAYLGIWYNKRTRRTRYVGPYRARISVEKAPNNFAGTKRNEPFENWVLQEVLISELEWKTAE